MILVIHGENITQSRKYLLEIKNSSSNSLSLDGSNLKISDLTQIIQADGLFEEHKNIFIEEFLSKKKQGKEAETIISYLQEKGKNHKIVFWESRNLTPSQLKIFKNSEMKKFDFPKIIFSFLDSLLPGNFKQSVNLFHQTLITQEAEIVFFMLTRHFRILLSLSEDESEIIDEAKKLAPWQKTKLYKQIKAFGKDKLLMIYNQLFEIEKGLKTGQLPLGLTQAIDFILISI